MTSLLEDLGVGSIGVKVDKVPIKETRLNCKRVSHSFAQYQDGKFIEKFKPTLSIAILTC